MPARKSAARATRPLEPEGALALLTVGDIDDVRDAVRAIATSLPRIEKVMRDQLATVLENNRNTAAIAEHTKDLPQLAKDLGQLLDVLVPKRTNGSTDLHSSSQDVEGPKP